MGDMMERFFESTRNYYQPQGMLGSVTDFTPVGLGNGAQSYASPYTSLSSLWGKLEISAQLCVFYLLQMNILIKYYTADLFLQVVAE